MSDGRRIRLVAVGAALVAMAFTLVAVVVVLSRGDAPAKPPPIAKDVGQYADRTVLATDAVRLQSGDVELVVEGSVTKGLRVRDAELAKVLGLDDGDMITAISGKQITRDTDTFDVILKLSVLHAATMYVEVERKDPHKPTLMRWK